MHKLQHPIAMFVLAVLAVIGIGVVVVAATTGQLVYGPSWGRFSAAFAGRVFEHRGYGMVSVPGAPQDLTPFSSSVILRLPVFAYSTASTPWIAYATGSYLSPNELDVGVEGVIPAKLADVVVRQTVSPMARVLFGPRVTEDEQAANGFSVITIGPQCSNGQCRAAQVISNGRVLWWLLAISAGPASTVERFLDSFRPLG